MYIVNLLIYHITTQEHQSFMDLSFSKDKVTNWVEWHPTIKGPLNT